MKRLLALAALMTVTTVCSVYGSRLQAQTPPITVPPQWATPEQAQASEMAVPAPEPMPKTAFVITLCNKVVGLFVIDDTGELHQYPFTAKEQVDNVLALVPADHAKALNVGCPSNAMKDVTVL